MLVKTVAPIHWDDFSGKHFERLVFAYFLRTETWKSLEWNGQCGKDGGFDIIGSQEHDGLHDWNVCIFCANWKTPTIRKIESDFNKVAKNSKEPIDKYIVVFGGDVSAKFRSDAKSFFESKKVYHFRILSGMEFEENLRAHAESLLKRFIQGEDFPEEPDRLEQFVNSTKARSDDEILALMAFCFDRPAFTTPFKFESYLPAFDRAMTDTISAINTGLCKDRDGNIIRRILPKSSIKNDNTRNKLSEIVRKIEKLRALFDKAIRNGEIRDYGGEYDKTSTIEFRDHRVCYVLDTKRREILEDFRSIYPNFFIHTWESF